MKDARLATQVFQGVSHQRGSPSHAGPAAGGAIRTTEARDRGAIQLTIPSVCEAIQLTIPSDCGAIRITSPSDSGARRLAAGYRSGMFFSILNSIDAGTRRQEPDGFKR